MIEDEITRDESQGKPEPEPEVSCSQCYETATYRINTAQPGKRRKRVELFFCDYHYNRWQQRTHPYAYSIKKLKPD